MINPQNFYQRTKLFKEIIYEIFKVESNYRTDLSLLNLKLSTKIEDSKINNKTKKSKLDFFRHSIPFKENINKLFHSSIKSSKSVDVEVINEKEENPFIDSLVSEGLQQLLNFYRKKHNLISKEVAKLGTILYNFSSQKMQTEMNDKEILNLEKNQIEFDNNYNNLTMAKEKYFDKMNELEIFFHNDDKNINNNNKKEYNNFDIINEDEIEKQKIDELIQYRKSYKKSLDDINNTQRIYISQINQICNEIQEFNIIENNIFYNIFKTFNEHLLYILKEVDNYCLLYENNQKLIQDLNIEFSKNLVFDNKINMNYQFEEYNPKYNDMHNKKDLSVIQKMHKLIGFEFNKINKNENDDIKNNNNKDNNVLFIILMDKFINGENKLNEKEKSLLKSLLNQEKYINEFLSKLNTIRINKKLFYNKEKFNVLFELFDSIYSKVSFGDEKNHEIVKLLMILSETFYYKNENKKIFLNNVLKIPKELKDYKFWIQYIELEIEKENRKMSDANNNNKNKKKTKYEYIVLISNITHLKEYIGEKEQLKNIIVYFKDKYNFSVDDFDIIKSQLNI